MSRALKDFANHTTLFKIVNDPALPPSMMYIQGKCTLMEMTLKMNRKLVVLELCFILVVTAL